VADELPYLLAYVGDRVADAAGAYGLPRTRVHLDKPPSGAAGDVGDEVPFVVVQLQGGGSDIRPPVNGRGIVPYVFTVRIVSGGDSFTVGAVTAATRPLSVARLMDAIFNGLHLHRGDVVFPDGSGAHVTIRAGGALPRAPEEPASAGGAVWINQGRQYEVTARIRELAA
jgi:hypothetical protein